MIRLRFILVIGEILFWMFRLEMLLMFFSRFCVILLQIKGMIVLWLRLIWLVQLGLVRFGCGIIMSYCVWSGVYMILYWSMFFDVFQIFLLFVGGIYFLFMLNLRLQYQFWFVILLNGDMLVQIFLCCFVLRNLFGLLWFKLLFLRLVVCL